MTNEDEILICDCGKCEECRQRELSSVVGECNCTYEDVTKEDGYTESVLVTQCDYHKKIADINLKYDNYRLLEKANINEDLWDLCTVVDGVIYTPQIEIDTANKTIDEKLTELITQVTVMDETIAELMLNI